MGSISKNFSYREFEASNNARKAHIINAITTTEIRDSIKSLVDNVLQPLRDKWANPMPINSGYRCPELNKHVGGVPTSQHVKGEAADVGTDDPLGLAQCAKDNGIPYDQMILYPTFVHFSHKRVGNQRGQVLYNRRYKGEKVK